MRIIRETRIRFEGEGGIGDAATLELGYDNRGEPYRKGISLHLDVAGRSMLGVFLEDYEAIKVRDLLNAIYPVKP